MVKRRFLTCLLALVASLCLTLFAVGCGETEQKKPSISISETTVEMGLFEEKVLTATLTNSNETIVWASSDATIITVVDGKVTALGIGEANVTVTAGSVSATCAVTVNRGTLTPEFDVLEDTLTLVKGAAYPLDASMILGEAEFDKATVSYEVVGTDGKVSVNEDGVITALDYGTQELNVSAIYKGLTLVTKTISVTVIETGEIQTGIVGNAIALTATAIGEDGVNEFDTKNFKAIINGQEVAKTLTLTSNDDAVVEISGSKIIAKKQGSALVTAKFTADSNNEYDVILTVNVTKETVSIKTNFAVQSSNDAKNSKTGSTELDLSSANLPIALSEVNEITSGEIAVEYTTADSVLTLTDAPAGEHEYKLITDRVDVIINGLIYQSTISNAEEYKTYFANIGSYVGYTILTADIDLAGALVVSNSWWAGTLDGRGHTVSNFNAPTGFMAQTNEKAIVKNLQLINMVVSNNNGGIIGSSYLGHMENVLMLAKITGAADEQSVVMSGEYNDCELKNVIIVVTADNDDAEYFGFGKSYSQGNGITTDNAYLVFDKEITLKKDTATNNNVVLCTSAEDLLSKIDADAFEAAGWTVDGTTVPYMRNFNDALENVFYTVDGDLKANSTVTIQASLFDAEYSLKNAVNGITLNGNVITIGDVTAATAFTFVVKSNTFGVSVEIPMQTYNYNTVTYEEDYLAIKDGKTTLDVDKIPGFSGDVKKVTVNGVDANATKSGTTVTFNNNEVDVQSVAVYSETDVYTFDVVIADVVVTNGSELFATLRLNGRQATRRYIVLANDIQLDDTQFDSGFLMDFVFDGLGNTIYDGYEYSGLFCNDANAVTFKNVNFVNFKTATSIFGGKFVGKMTFENVNFINTKFPGFNGATYLLYNVNYDGTEVLFKNCNFDFNVDNAHVDKTYQLLNDDGKYKSITFDNVKFTANANIVKIGENGYGANFTVNGLVITDKNDITKLTYDGNPVASSSQTIVDLTKLSTNIDADAIESVYIGGAEVTFTVDGDILYINKAVLGMTEIDVFTESGVYSVAVTVKDYSTSVTYNADYVKSTNGTITFDLSKISGFSGTVTKVNCGNLDLTVVEQNGNSLTVSGSNAWNTSTFTIHTATVGYKFSVLVVTDLISDEASWKAFMESGTQNRYALVTADFNLASEYELKTAFICNVVIDGQNHVIGGENVYNWSGLFANSITSSTIKNITFNKIKGFASVLGGSMNDVTFENIVIKNGFAPGGKYGNNLLFSSIGNGKYLTFKNCAIALTIDNTLINNAYVLGTLNEGSTLNFENTTITFNGTMVKPGETFNNAVWGGSGVNLTGSILRDKDDVAETSASYTEDYLAIVDGKVTVDFNKISGADIDPATIKSVAVNSAAATWSLGTDNKTLIITTDAFGEGKIIQITVDSGDVIDTISFEVIFANFVLSDEATFKAWATAGNGTAGGKYAVISQDITLTADVELNAPWFGGWTLNGLGHTVKNLYDYSGFMPGGAGGVTIKNVTLNIKTCSSAFGDDWYGTNNFENVKITVSVPGHAGTSRLLFDRVRADTVFNFKNCEFTFNIDSGKQANEMLLMKFDNSGIKVNLTNSTIKSTGTIAALNSSVTLDATSSITDKNGAK